MEKDAKIYVAGHKGLLGSAVVRKLKEKGHHNLVLRSKEELNLIDQSQTLNFFHKERPEFVFLCAAKVGGIIPNMEEPADFLYENLQIQNNVISASHQSRVKKLLFVGSTCIYPKDTEIPLKEEKLLSGPLEPTNEGYALAKLAGIKLCQYFKKQYGCDFISAIPTNQYGINDRYDPIKSHFLPALILKIHKAKKNQEPSITLWGTGTPRREFMLSDDSADALYFLMQKYSGEMPINVGIGEDLSILELAQVVMKVLDVNLNIRFDRTRPDGMMRKLTDISRLKKLGWTSKIPLEEGIKIAYQDFLQRMNT